MFATNLNTHILRCSMFFLNMCMQIPLKITRELWTRKLEANTALYEKSLLFYNHLRQKDMTELITHGESHFTMEVCSLPRQLLINSRTRCSFKTHFCLFYKYIKCLHIGNVGSAQISQVSMFPPGFKIFI